MLQLDVSFEWTSPEKSVCITGVSSLILCTPWQAQSNDRLCEYRRCVFACTSSVRVLSGDSPRLLAAVQFEANVLELLK